MYRRPDIVGGTEGRPNDFASRGGRLIGTSAQYHVVRWARIHDFIPGMFTALAGNPAGSFERMFGPAAAAGQLLEVRIENSVGDRGD